jgi:hypothetical protein
MGVGRVGDKCESFYVQESPERGWRPLGIGDSFPKSA